MFHQVDFAGPFGVPQVDGKHVEGGVDLTDEKQSVDGQPMKNPTPT